MKYLKISIFLTKEKQIRIFKYGVFGNFNFLIKADLEIPIYNQYSMAENIYYYIKHTLPPKLESTTSIDDFISALAEGSAELIDDSMRISLNLPPSYIADIKKEISSYEERVPLYDINFNHIFLINKDNIYPRVLNYNYRFIDENFYSDLIKLSSPTDSDKENLRILSNYDFPQLYQTYIKIFYESFILNSFITNCRRPSFSSGMDHIQPYYTINELNYFAQDWNLSDHLTMDKKELND